MLEKKEIEYKKIVVTERKLNKDIEIDSDRLVKVSGVVCNGELSCDGKGLCIAARTTDENGDLGGKSLCLDASFDWVLGKDEYGLVCLVPLKEEE